MDTDALFSFLHGEDVDSMAVDNDAVSDANGAAKATKRSSKKKRKADSSRASAAPESEDSPTISEPVQKKARIASPEVFNPVVLDEFETVAKREVAANAGLTSSSADADQRLELRHQVRLAL